MIRKEIVQLIEKSIKELQKAKKLPDFEISEILVEKPEEKSHGDYATNIAMTIGRLVKKNPSEVAEKLRCTIQDTKYKILDRIETAAPGFINFFISKEYLQKQVEEILKQKDKFGNLKIGKGKKINVEFISANPTGPLTLGNGRGGFCGDVLANVLDKAGYEVEREYYINDVGEQIKKLGHSVIGDKEAVYRGLYVEELRMRLVGASVKEAEEVGRKSAEIILGETIKPQVLKMGIEFNVWFRESELYKKKEIDKILEELERKNLSYKKEGALWFQSTKFGDDKDRVLVKADGEKTYLASDIAYLKNKFKRGFDKLIYFFGADHYGYVGRIKAAAEALGFKKEQVEMIIMQLVRLIEGGKEMKMSKRTGFYVTIDELIGEVGLDVARFFFLARSPDTHLNFDLDLAKQQSEKNPVFYVQYAHARIRSILRKSEIPASPSGGRNSKFENLELLTHPSELSLIKQLIRLPEIIEDTVEDYQVQRLPQYALDVATVFHQFYRDCRVISEEKALTQARLSLVSATGIMLKNTLNLMGISAPEKM